MQSKRTGPKSVCCFCGRECYRRPSELRRQGRVFCTRECYRLGNVRPLHIRYSKYVDKSSFDGCWLWTGGKNNMGYGMLSSVLAHRIAYEVASGTLVPSTAKVLHTCDIPLCVRNDEPGTYEIDGEIRVRFGHLFLGTQQDNMTDMKTKERGALGERNSSVMRPERVARGINLPQAKMTESLVRELRLRYARGGISQAALACEYGIGQMTVSQIVRRTSWRHVE